MKHATRSRLLAPRPLAPKSLAPKSLAPKFLAPKFLARSLLVPLLLAFGTPAGLAQSMLDGVFPRGVKLCYATAPEAGSIAMLRLTRPMRINKFDSRSSRVVRLVVNFRDGARVEDNATCREEGGRLLCQSTTCEAAGFRLFKTGERDILFAHGRGEGFVAWACALDRPPSATERMSLRRGRGSCL